MSDAPKRVPVDFDYAAIHPQFLKGLARIAGYAAGKYGSWHQYLGSSMLIRLTHQGGKR